MWSALASAAASLRVPWPAAGDNNPADGPPEGAAELAEALAAACQRLAWLAQLPPDERGAVAAAAGGAATADGAFPPGFEPPKPEPIAGGGDAGGDAGGDDPGGARAALLARACALLRCSHVAGLRRLQSRCDAALVAAQECTAQPRTDARLARTGR